LASSNTITARAFKKLLDTGKIPPILDIRSPAEYDDFNFGGTHIPFEQLLQNPSSIVHLKTKTAIVLCYTGLQSEIARSILTKKGFTKLKNLEGGIEAYLSL
jgi:rhodanese-related sulfurtransferase